MSDTITPEERAGLRSIAEYGEKHKKNLSSAHVAGNKKVLRLLNALEAAEKALLQEEVYSEELESQLQDAESEYNANWAVQAISDVARLVGVLEQCSETGDDIGAATLEAVQDLKTENARLTAERDWLANKLIDCPPKFTNCAVDCAECRKEAARRAVSESEVGK